MPSDKNFRDTPRKVLFVLALLAMVGVLVWIAWILVGGGLLGLLVGITLAGPCTFVLVYVYNRTTPGRRKRTGEVVAGTVSCPSCGSLQTDREREMGADGTERTHWRCYTCDHSRE